MKLCAASIGLDIGFSNTAISKHNLQIFHQDVAICVIHECMGSEVSSVFFTSNFGLVEGIIGTPARLDASVATTATCLPADRSEKVGSNCRQL